MKTSSFARGILRIRAIRFSLALVGLVGLELGLGASMTARFGQYTAAQTEAMPVPNLSLGDWMAAGPVAR